MDTTLLITTYNRAKFLQHSLERLKLLTLPEEIIVVDDGGNDQTKQVCDDWEHPITYIYNNNPGPTICSLARNIGIRHASYDWIITSEPELVFISDIVPQFKELHKQWPTKIISTGLVHYGHAHYFPHNPADARHQCPEKAIKWVSPHAALWNRKWLEEVGGWDEAFPNYWGWDDTDLLTRLRLMGHGQHIDKSVEALHLYHGIGAGDHDEANARHFFSKDFVTEPYRYDSTSSKDVVANQDREWGKLRT